MDDKDRVRQNIEGCTVPNQWLSYFEQAEDAIAVQWDEFIWPALKDFDLHNA